MVNERPRAGGFLSSLTSSFQSINRPGTRQPSASATVSPGPRPQQRQNDSLSGKGLGLGKGKASKRHRKVLRDTIHGVTKGDIRRLARRGGVKRLSANIYDDIRAALKQRLELILKDCTALVEHSGRKTICATDVIFTLNRLGRPLYGYDAAFNGVR